jgi:hypothetical protein
MAFSQDPGRPRNGPNARLLEGGDARVVQQGPVGADHDHEAVAGGVARQGENIRAQQRLAASQHHHGLVAEGGDLVDQRGDLFGVEFIRSAAAACAGVQIAVRALQVATARQIERDQKGRFGRLSHLDRPRPGHWACGLRSASSPS